MARSPSLTMTFNGKIRTMTHLLHLAREPSRAPHVAFDEDWFPDATSRSSTGRGLSLGDRRARAGVSPRESVAMPLRTRRRASGIRRGASRSHGVLVRTE